MTAVIPMPLPLISTIASAKLAVSGTVGSATPVRMTSRTWVRSLRPSEPPGCERAKSSTEKPRASSKVSASASPSASAAVVLAVGASPSGQASVSTLASRCTSAANASDDCSLPVSAINLAPWRLKCGTRDTSSSVSPEFESSSTMSSAVIMPRSPGLASATCTKNPGVPVDASVAAMLRAIWPDLPMPVTTTRPRHSNSARAAARNAAPRRASSARMAAASVASTARASLSTRSGSMPTAGTGSAARIGADMRASIAQPPPGPLGRCATFAGPRCADESSMPQTLQLILLLLAAAVVVVVACRLLRLPPILGYLVVGIAVGPHAFAWVPDNADVRDLAEFGIVFLMFSIGLEFSLPQLKAMRRAVFGLGLAQVAITTVAAMIVSHRLGYRWLAGLALGGAVTMSSTAIVSKMLAERTELNTAHGRDALGILLFQDLAVIAFLIAIPTLAEGAADLWKTLALAGVKAALALAVILFFGQRPIRAWFHLVARQRSSELFMLNILLVTLGLASLTQIAGLSFALGAFLAGMLIAETEYRYQVEEDIKPFRDVLLGLFFVTVGMYLDLTVVGHYFGWVCLLLLGPVLAKLALIVLLAKVFGAPLGTALRTGFYLAQAGEFAIVLLALSTDLGIIDRTLSQLVLAAMVLSMLSAPFLIQFAEPLARRLTANDWLMRATQPTNIAARTLARQDHVLLCGYGRSGQNPAGLLGAADIAF